tara:strand:- start:40 stop:360 length:321 start_codon:yes stop_codon:yes gene_type:complete
MSEKRIHERYKLQLKIYDLHENLLGVTKDVSIEGCFIETEHDINWDDLNILIEISSGEKPLHAECQIVRSVDEGYGVKLEFSEENGKILSQLIESLKNKQVTGVNT